jgi:hypothetical protein
LQVRGTPGSGKSTLVTLLRLHILNVEPESSVHIIDGWPDKPFPGTKAIDYESRLMESVPGYPAKSRTYLLFDEGQDTYWDIWFWNNFIKNRHLTYYCIILFCTYGSPSSRPVDFSIGNPPRLVPKARVSLWPTDVCPGILYTRTEYDEVVSLLDSPLNLHPDLQTLLFYWTSGHAGAVASLLTSISQQASTLSAP